MEDRPTIFDTELECVIIDVSLDIKPDIDNIYPLSTGDICVVENGTLIKAVEEEDITYPKDFCIFWNQSGNNKALVSLISIPNPMSINEWKHFCIRDIRRYEWNGWYFSVNKNHVNFKKKYNVNPLMKIIRWIMKLFS